MLSTTENVIEWLEINRGHGAFDGFMEETLDFRELTYKELEWYYYEWMLPDVFIELELPLQCPNCSKGIMNPTDKVTFYCDKCTTEMSPDELAEIDGYEDTLKENI